MKLDFSLKKKILLILSFPVIGVVSLSAVYTHEAWINRKAASHLLENVKLMGVISETVHLTQGERGKSFLFLKGRLEQAKLEEQRSENDKKLKALKEAIAGFWARTTLEKGFGEIVGNIAKARSEVDAKVDPAIEIQHYNALVAGLIQVAVTAAQSESIGGMRSYLLTQTLLESAKDSVGGLQNDIPNIIVEDKPVERELIEQLRMLEGGVLFALGANTNEFSEEGHKMLVEFNSYPAWRRLQALLNLVSARSGDGAYRLSADTAIKDAADAMEYLNQLLMRENSFVKKSAEKLSADSTFTFFATLFLSVMGCLGLTLTAWRVIGKLSHGLEGVASGLEDSTSKLNNVAQQVANASTELSSSTSQLAAALQETVSSIDEVGAMVGKNADNAKRSQNVAMVSQETANKGKQVVGEMIQSIEEINRSNADIMQQIHSSNQEISNIVEVITEIGNKTKVINDIVFQTKLLSFNASVEAARAGEHGKGFAVVAEEVGNLAQMSGSAAKEISQMLEGSIQKVESIVTETKSRVERLVAVGKDKVEHGTKTARRCGEVLDEIVNHVAEVNHMVAEIATASQEQSTGVNEITKAMNQMDQVTQQNASASHEAATAAEQLRAQAVTLREASRQLIQTVRGGQAESIDRSASESPAQVPQVSQPQSSLPQEPEPQVKAENVVQFPKRKVAESTPVPSQFDDRFEEV